MKFQQLYSSSHYGNLYLVTANNSKRLLIECGVSWKEILKALNYDISNIEGCLLSHEHKDHSKAVSDVMRAGINVYMSDGTIEALNLRGQRRAIPVDYDTVNRIGEFGMLPFHTNHDAKEPIGFLVKADNQFLFFATDTSHITQHFTVKNKEYDKPELRRFDIIAIECSYDKDILQAREETKQIPTEVAKRLLTSHMEKYTAMRYLSNFCDLSKCQEIHLLHMSGDNLNKLETQKEFEQKFNIETRIVYQCQHT